MSLRAVTAFPIHNENESSFHRGILKQKDAGPVLNDASTGVPSVVKPTLAPKSERKALSTLNNNALNSRVLPNNGKLGLGKPGAPGSILKPIATEKKPKIQFLPVSTTMPAPAASQIYIPADEELVCSGSTAAVQWDSLQDPLDSSLLQYEKMQLIAAADEEREQDRLEQEERDRQRAANVMLEELAKEMTDMFEDDFTAIDYFT